MASFYMERHTGLKWVYKILQQVATDVDVWLEQIQISFECSRVNRFIIICIY